MSEKNQLYYGDNLEILRRHVADETVDLIYLDPPFNSNATYNVLFAEKGGERSAAQITAFDDTWHWGLESEAAFQDAVTHGPKKLSDLMQAMRTFLGSNDMLAYLTMMAVRLVELHRVLKPTGSIYLHCDPTASHYLKLVMDAVFGFKNYRNEITWKRTSGHGDARRGFADVTDIIFFYTKTDDYPFQVQYVPYSQSYIDTFYVHQDPDGRRWRRENLSSPHPRPNLTYEYKGWKPPANGWRVSREVMEQLDREGRLHFPQDPNGRIRRKCYLDEAQGQPVTCSWDDIPPIHSLTAERLGYPTQKPEALLERVLQASSNEGDLVLDPFCGCGTTIAAAEHLRRRWIGIDITHLAIALMKSRLQTAFGAELAPYEVLGVPKDLAGAAALAKQDPYQFEWWSLGLVDARPAQDKKKGADRGIDGHIYFFDDNSGQAKRIIVSVKSGHVTVSQVRDLKGVLEREKAAIGVFLTLQDPTKPMREEAAAAGFYHPPLSPQDSFPRVQLFTIAELLAGKRVEYPRYAPAATFKQAARKGKDTKQGELF